MMLSMKIITKLRLIIQKQINVFIHFIYFMMQNVCRSNSDLKKNWDELW